MYDLICERTATRMRARTKTHARARTRSRTHALTHKHGRFLHDAHAIGADVVASQVSVHRQRSVVQRARDVQLRRAVRERMLLPEPSNRRVRPPVPHQMRSNVMHFIASPGQSRDAFGASAFVFS